MVFQKRTNTVTYQTRWNLLVEQINIINDDTGGCKDEVEQDEVRFWFQNFLQQVFKMYSVFQVKQLQYILLAYSDSNATLSSYRQVYSKTKATENFDETQKAAAKSAEK